MVRLMMVMGLAIGGCARRPPVTAEMSPLEAQLARAEQPGRDQTLEQARFVSMALAAGENALAEHMLREVVQRMQDFRADGEFRALVGREDRKEWKGDASEKMMAFLYLGLLLLEQGDYGNAVAMSKSAVLADTGTARLQYRADFVPAYVLRALAYQGLGKTGQAERAVEEAVDAVRVRLLTGCLAELLDEVTTPAEVDFDSSEAARVLLVEALPAGLRQHPRDPEQAIRAALGRATELRQLVLETRKRDRPGSLGALRKRDVRDALDALGALAEGWRDVVRSQPLAVLDEADEAARFLRGLVADPPRLVLWLESGRAPMRVRDGSYGQILRLEPFPRTGPPTVTLDGRPVVVHPLDSVAFQATTRGSRPVEGFLKGKAVFKDTAGVLGFTLFATGDAIEGQEGAILQLIGAAVWLGGALANPAADVRSWTELPDRLWLVRADPAPGSHTLTVDGRTHTVLVPDEGTISHLIPGRPPGGASTFGEPCRECAPAPQTEPDAPLAIPARGEP